MDFGSIRIFRPDFVSGVIDLYKALRDSDEALALQAYEKWGFHGLDKEAIEVLNMWAGFIYAPLLEDGVRPIQQMRGGSEGRELAGKVHQELKADWRHQTTTRICADGQGGGRARLGFYAPVCRGELA